MVLLLPNAKTGDPLPDALDLRNEIARFAAVESRRAGLPAPSLPDLPYDPLSEKSLPLVFQQLFLDPALDIRVPQISPEVTDTLDMTKIAVPDDKASEKLPKSPRQEYLEGLLEINEGLQKIVEEEIKPQGRYALRPFITTLIDAARLDFDYRKMLSSERSDYELALTRMFALKLKREIADEKTNVSIAFDKQRNAMESAMNRAAIATEQAAAEWAKIREHMARASATQGKKEPYDPYPYLLELVKHYEELQLAQMDLIEARLALTTFEKAGLDSLIELLDMHTTEVRRKVIQAVMEQRIKTKPDTPAPAKGKKQKNDKSNRAA